MGTQEQEMASDLSLFLIAYVRHTRILIVSMAKTLSLVATLHTAGIFQTAAMSSDHHCFGAKAPGDTKFL